MDTTAFGRDLKKNIDSVLTVLHLTYSTITNEAFHA